MDKKEKAKLREEAEKEALTAEDIISIKRLHERGRTNEEISLGLDLHMSTVNAALSRGIHPLKEEEEGDDNQDQD